MGTGNGLFQTIGLIDNGFALGRKIVDQCAQTHFILIVSCFNRCDFRMNDGFKLGRTRNSAFDPVTHSRHFAANGLRKIENGIGGHRLGFDHAHGHFGHGLRNSLHFLGAARQIGDTEHGRNRQSKANRRHYAFRLAHG